MQSLNGTGLKQGDDVLKGHLEAIPRKEVSPTQAIVKGERPSAAAVCGCFVRILAMRQFAKATIQLDEPVCGTYGGVNRCPGLVEFHTPSSASELRMH